MELLQNDSVETTCAPTSALPEWNPINGPPCCTGCEKVINEPTVSVVLGQPWHRDCLRCTDCNVQLQPTCYLHRDMTRRPYCQKHFHRHFGPRCSGCREIIPPAALVMRAHHNVYHPHCFRCIRCHAVPATGSEFHLTYDNKVLCKDDYDSMKRDAKQATASFLAMLNVA